MNKPRKKKNAAKHLAIAKSVKATMLSMGFVASIYVSRRSSSVYVSIRRNGFQLPKLVVRVADHEQDYLRDDNQSKRAFETIGEMTQVQEVCRKVEEALRVREQKDRCIAPFNATGRA